MDFWILYRLQELHNGFLDGLMTGISFLGNAGWFWIVLTILLLCIPRYRKSGIVMALALILDLCICNLALKPLVARERPCWIDPTVKLLLDMPTDYSFPSGHSAASFAAAAGLFFYHRREGSAALIVASLIAFSRLYLFVHFPTDVLGGILTGLLCAYLARAITEKAGKYRASEKKEKE
ncbi:MAG: phosphatase PAP2 family protein [Fusicatenibacter sp.]